MWDQSAGLWSGTERVCRVYTGGVPGAWLLNGPTCRDYCAGVPDPGVTLGLPGGWGRKD